MKITLFRLALVLAGLALVMVPREKAEPTAAPPTAVATPAPVVAAASASAEPAVAPSEMAALPPEVKLSPGASEIVKLAQSGLGEPVMLAYIDTVTRKFNLNSDQIVYLNDIGVAADVVKAMIQRDAALDPNGNAASNPAATATANPPPIPPAPPSGPMIADTGSTIPAPVNPNFPGPMDATLTCPPPAPPVDDSSVNPPDYAPNQDVDYFYDSLAPYGNWVYVAGCGRCWQPTVVRTDAEWRPYNDRGRWLYTDCGWYWQSDYSWGWAAFHYGRWFAAPNRGWVWAPDRVWGPAWVSWRRGEEFCGWAPLPPSAHFLASVGLVYGNRQTPANFEFGLRTLQYTFIPLARMTDYAPARYAVPAWQAGEVSAKTAVVNQYIWQHNRVVNHGVDPNEVAAASGTEIRRAEVRELRHDANRAIQPDRLTKSGDTLLIFRPQLPATEVRPAAQAASAAGSREEVAAYAAPSHVSVMQPGANAPIYLSGSSPQPDARAGNYPRGSLIVIGDRKANNSAASTATPGANSRVLASHVTVYQSGQERAGQGYYPQGAAAQGQTPYVIPARYTAGQQLFGSAQRAESAPAAVVERAPAPTATATDRAPREARVETEYRAAAVAHVPSANAPQQTYTGSTGVGAGHK